MADENKSRTEAPLHYEGGVPVLPGPAEREQAARDRQKSEDSEYKSEQTSLQRRILVTQVILACVAVIGGGFTYWQTSIAQQSADTSQKSVLLAQKTERDARLMSEKQADSSQRQFEVTSKASQKQFERTLMQFQSQTEAQQSSAEAAGDAVNATRDAMYLEQRPWVGVQVIPSQANPNSNPNLISVAPGAVAASVAIVAINTGKTPALHWKQSCAALLIHPIPSAQEFPTCEELKEMEGRANIEDEINRTMTVSPQSDREATRKRIEQSYAWINGHEHESEVGLTGRTIVPGQSTPLEGFTEIGGADYQTHYWVETFTYYDLIAPSKQHITRVCLQRRGIANWSLCDFGQEME